MLTFYMLVNGEIRETTDVREWGRWYETTPERIVEQTRVGQRDVSTIFLGIDHNFFGKGPPLLFETMVFNLDSGSSGEEQRRWATLKEAKLGHLAICRMLEVEGAPVV